MMFNTDHNLELMAGALYRIVEGGHWLHASPVKQANYIAVCRQTVESVQLEQRQQPEDGRKEVA